MKKIALISTPWPLFNRPSIQLGSLKTFLRKRLPQIEVNNLHFYLNIAYRIGYELYSKISESTWLSEPVYAAILYPEKRGHIEKLWKRYARRILKKKVDFYQICELVEEESLHILESIDWSKYFLVGLSCCFSQLTSSLYFIKEIKKRSSKIKIVIGGSSCSEDMGKSLIQNLEEIDFVIQGEGELPLSYLVSCLIEGKEVGDFPGILSKSNCDLFGVSQINNLDKLPIPDYSDYFIQAERISSKRPFQIKLPMEISRGCWWGRCRFCNLNIQWRGYRSKSKERVISEIRTLIERHQILSISFMDNLIPPNSKEIFVELSKIKKDLSLFAEIRANTPLDLLIWMGKAGMNEIQVGVEALSSRLLKKMNKGTTAIQNIEIMKNCEAKGMPKIAGNLILEFPGSDEEDVKETLNNLDFVFPFYPLKGISFWLGYGSFVWNNPGMFFIRKTGNHPNYSYIFPEEIFKSLILMIQGYKGKIREQKRLWDPVRKKVSYWTKYYMDMHSLPKDEPILGYQDGGNFLIIRQRISKEKNMIHKLKGLSRSIYLFCQKNKSVSEILDHFLGLDHLKLLPFLKMMVDKRLMFGEGNRYLSLAVPLRGWGKS